jgi:hypothetical protein
MTNERRFGMRLRIIIIATALALVLGGWTWCMGASG